MKTRLAATVVAAAVAGVAAFAAAARAEGVTYSGYLRTPSGSVYCDYLYGSQVVAKYRYVRCGFSGTLSPQEPKPTRGCPRGTDYMGNRLQVMEQGRGQTQACVGDAGPFAHKKAAVPIPYGHTWHGAEFSCVSFKEGMTCKSADGHGFRLAQRGWRVF